MPNELGTYIPSELDNQNMLGIEISTIIESGIGTNVKLARLHFYGIIRN